MIRIPVEFLWLAIIAGAVYLSLARKDVRFGQLRLSFLLALLWSAWTLFIVISVGPQLTGLFSPDQPSPIPSPSTIKRVLFTFMVLPTAIVQWFMVGTEMLVLRRLGGKG
ncbi:hypothetical protein EU520_00845 [Candidatus Thorarchaeota archaeon]|nr:MAG: hypothetical protein EU520_00845 [Candidatus Thorarchaeota archaeon]